MTREEAEAALQAWATVQREELVQAAYEAGVSKNRIHVITGLARTTIDRILENPMAATQQRITEYLQTFTSAWPRQSWYRQPTMASAYTAAQVAQALLRDAQFRALRLGTWLSTPDGKLLAAAVEALLPPPYREDAALLVDALQLAAQQQHEEARQKVFAGIIGVAAAAAIAYGASQG